MASLYVSLTDERETLLGEILVFILILIIVPSIMSCGRDLVYIDGEAIIKRGEDGVEGNDSKKCNRNQASRIREVT